MTPQEWACVLASLPEGELPCALLALSDEDWLAEQLRGWLREMAARPEGFSPNQNSHGNSHESTQLRDFGVKDPFWWTPDFWDSIDHHWATRTRLDNELFERLSGPVQCICKGYATGQAAWADLLRVLGEGK